MFGKWLKQFDVYGADISFYYKGEGKFHTAWGCIVTLFVAMVYLFMISLKFIEFFDETDPIEQLSEAIQSLDEVIDLTSNGFSFAVENIDERIGKIQAYQVKWDVYNGK